MYLDWFNYTSQQVIMFCVLLVLFQTLSEKKDFDWMTIFEKQSNMLMRHLSPPILRGNFPLQDTGVVKYLSLSGVRLYRNNRKYLRLLTLLKRNPG